MREEFIIRRAGMDTGTKRECDQVLIKWSDDQRSDPHLGRRAGWVTCRVKGVGPGFTAHGTWHTARIRSRSRFRAARSLESTEHTTVPHRKDGVV